MASPLTYIKVKGESKYLYRAIDSKSNTIYFLSSAKQGCPSSESVFFRAFQRLDSRKIRVINTDKDKAYPKTIKELKESEILPDYVEHRAVKYQNNIIEQDHRYIKRRVIASQNFREFDSASRTISGYESMNMMASHARETRPCGIAMLIRKGQIKNVERGNVLGQIKFIHSVFGIAV